MDLLLSFCKLKVFLLKRRSSRAYLNLSSMQMNFKIYIIPSLEDAIILGGIW